MISYYDHHASIVEFLRRHGMDKECDDRCERAHDEIQAVLENLSHFSHLQPELQSVLHFVLEVQDDPEEGAWWL